MSDNCLHIVPKHKEDYRNSKLKAKEIVEWFQARDTVEHDLSNCILSTDKKGYRFKPNIAAIFNDGDLWAYDDSLRVCGLELTYDRRTVFHPMEGAHLIMRCPNCGKIIAEDMAYQWINDWYKNKGKDYQNCPNCNKKKHLTEYNTEPEWAFSNIGISLWNTHWHLKPAFLAAMEKLFKAEVIVVAARI